MNKKINVKRSDGKIMSCVLSGDMPLENQFNLWMFGSETPSGAFRASLSANSLEIIDCIAYDRVENFDILSIEDTEEDVTSKWLYL